MPYLPFSGEAEGFVFWYTLYHKIVEEKPTTCLFVR